MIELGGARRAEEAVVADLGEVAGQDMLEEASDEFGGGDGAELDGVGAAISIRESNSTILETLQSAIGDGDAKEVTAEVGKDLLAASGMLAVHDPFLFLVPDSGRDLIE